MNSHNDHWNRSAESELAQVIEPLASYITATDRPRAALRSALAVLLRQIEQTNHAADALVASFSERCWS